MLWFLVCLPWQRKKLLQSRRYIQHQASSLLLYLVRPCDNNCKNEEINSFQPHLKRKWVCFPAEKADMFSCPRQIVYTSSQLKILIFDKEINNFERISTRKVNTSVFRRRKCTDDIDDVTHCYLLLHVPTRVLMFGDWQMKCDVNVCKQTSSLRLVFFKTNCNCNIWSIFLSAFVDLDKFFSFCGADLYLVRAARAARLFFLIQPIKSLFSRVVTIPLAVVLA